MKQKRIRILWGVFMTLIYLGMASLLVFSDIFNIQQVFRIIIGILLFIYGIFRGYRVWKMTE